MKHRPFEVKERSSKPVISVKYRGEDEEFVSFSCTNSIDNALIP